MSYNNVTIILLLVIACSRNGVKSTIGLLIESLRTCSILIHRVGWREVSNSSLQRDEKGHV